MYTKKYGEAPHECTVMYDDELCEGGVELAFTDPDTGEEPQNVYSFIGLAFHAAQQCGGITAINGIRIGALTMDQTSGEPIRPWDIVSASAEHLPFEYYRVYELVDMRSDAF